MPPAHDEVVVVALEFRPKRCLDAAEDDVVAPLVADDPAAALLLEEEL